MPLDEVTLTLDGEGYTYRITNIQGEDPSQNKNAVSIAPPGQAAANNILLGIQGQQADNTIRFFAHDDGTDKADGTAPGGEFTNDTVVTLAEQKRWLEEFVHAPAFDAAWTLDHANGEVYDDRSVFVENLTTPVFSVDQRGWIEWSIRVRRGESLA